ncbi:MAG TPA: lipid II flippase MurJ [Gammaproteobacteria bacterium]|nr:lipid II flippase MurJ [Gammaproteobacteria bacterium]
MLSTNALVLGSVAIGFASSVLIAALFGLSRRLDAYYAALMVPNLFVTLCLDYLGKNFLPVYARARAQSAQTASEVTSSVVTIVGLLAAALALALCLASHHVFRALLPGFDAADLGLVSRYFWIMAPAMVLTAVTCFHEYVCQHDEQYTRIAAITASQPVVNFIAIAGAGPIIGEYALPIGYVAGQAITFLLMTRYARYRYRPRFTVRSEWEKPIFTNTAVVMGSGLLVRTRTLITNFLASFVGDGAIAALNFGYRLIEPLERTTFSGVRRLMFSRTARLVIEDNSRELARLYRLALTASFLLLTPLLWWVVLERELVIGLLFERGAFNATMTALVAVTLIGYAPSVTFAGVNSILSNAFYAMSRIAVPALVMPIGTLLYLIVALAAYRPLGILGLALAPTTMHATVFVLLLFMLSKHMPQLEVWSVLGRIAAYVLLGGAALGLPQLLLAPLGLPKLVEAGLTLSVGVTLYFGVLAMARERTFLDVVSYFRRAHPLLDRRPAAT